VGFTGVSGRDFKRTGGGRGGDAGSGGGGFSTCFGGL
jgi:hypothetical protein